MKTICLYGALGKEYGRVHRYAVETPAEAIRALCATLTGFRQSLVNGEHYRVVIGGRRDTELGEIAYPISDKESIRIVPIVAGSGGFRKVLLGAALIGASFYTGGAATGFFSYGAGAYISSAAGNIGIALVLGGVSELLFKPPKAPKTQERPESTPSFIFNGAVNTTRQGNPVPICYGRMIIGSQVISAGLSVEQI